DERETPAVCRSVAKTCADHSAFTLTVEGIGCFGNPRSPRTIWAGVGAGATELVALHAALEPPLMELGCYRRDEGRLPPHITLGRGKNSQPQDTLADALKKQTTWKAGSSNVGEILVLSSELRSQGPLYTVLSTAKLGSAE